MIVARCMVLALLAAPIHGQGSQGATLTSPCPNVFVYDPPASEPGTWSGVVALTTDTLLHSTWLNIVLDSQAISLRNWVGSATTQDGVDFIIENDDMKIYPGQPVLLRFFIQYDPLNTTPRLRAIRLNGIVICNADTRQRGTFDRPVLSNVGQPGSSFPEPKIRTNLDKKPVRIPPSKPNRRPVNNNSSSAFNSKRRYSNTLTTSETVECGVVSGGNERISLSSNGMASTRGDIPWLVAIFKRQNATLRYLCAGTLVSDRHVITAGVCMQRRGGETAIIDFVVKIGAHNIFDWGEDITVTRTLVAASIHEDYNPSTVKNDILILTLNQRVKFNQYIRPACLWSGDTELSRVVGATGVVAGWGVQSGVGIGQHDEPHIVFAPIVSTANCRTSNALFHQLTYDTTFCAGARNGIGPCAGDSGAGLYLLESGKWRLRGIVSVSLRSGNENLPCDLNEYIVYTDAAQFLPWIKNILSQKYID